MKELWKDIVGYEGLYQVSNLGRVKRLLGERKNLLTGGSSIYKEHEIKRNKIGNQYEYVILSKNKKTRKKYVHQLVAEAFIPNPENKPQINHINGIKTDNRLENLEWVTRSENMQHAYRNNLIKKHKEINNAAANH